MKKAVLLVALASVLVAAGCASQSEVLAKQQPTAVTTAVKRAAFDFNCPDAKGEVISSDYIQPAGSGGRWMAVQGECGRRGPPSPEAPTPPRRLHTV